MAKATTRASLHSQGEESSKVYKSAPVTHCPNCDATGKIHTADCEVCSGTGHVKA